MHTVSAPLGVKTFGLVVVIIHLNSEQKRTRRLMELFIARVPADLAEFEALLAHADWGPLAAAVHRLKGSCFSVGALAMAGVLRQFEYDIRRQASVACFEHLVTLGQYFSVVAGLMQAELALLSSRKA
jgi:HPt (histidine-containing phosphotransfer) domain-containing protein